MNVIFLDIDGVLNNDKTNAKTPIGFTGINNSLLDKLSHFVKETNSKIVLSSTWKDEWDRIPNKRSLDGIYLHKKFLQKNIVIFDKIDDSQTGYSNRGTAIKIYLSIHPEIENYVIFDDSEFDFYQYEDLSSHFIQTDYKLGITTKNLEEAFDILNKEIDKARE